jgi:hypothetical protein
VSGPQHFIIAATGIIKNKLFPSNEQSDGGPSKKDNQKNNKLFDQFGVHGSSFLPRQQKASLGLNGRG